MFLITTFSSKKEKNPVVKKKTENDYAKTREKTLVNYYLNGGQ